MAEAIQERLKEPIAAYLEKGEKTLQSRIEVMLFESVEHLISKIQEELNEQFNGWISVLENKIDIDLIKRNLTVLEEL